MELSWFTSCLDLTTTLIAITTFVTAYWYVAGRPWKNYPPGPPSLPIVGSLPFLRDLDIRKAFVKLAEKYGDVVKMDIGSESVVVINGYECMKEAFLKTNVFASRPPNTLGIDYLYTNGIIMSHFDISKRRRAFVLHQLRNFGFGRNKMECDIRTEIQCLVEEMRKYLGTPFDPKPFFVKTAANVITSFAFGKRRRYDDPELICFMELMERLNNGFSRSRLSSLVPILKNFPGDPTSYYAMRSLIEKVRSYCLEWMNERKKSMKWDEEPTDLIEAYLHEVENHKDDPNMAVTEEEISWIMTDLYMAGTDTAGNTMAWGVLYMIRNPDIQKKVYAEIKDVIGSSRFPELQDRNKLPYTEAVLSELQRLGDLAPMSVPHASSEDTVFRGYHIPKGMTILPNLYSVHMDPTVWPDPETFDPSRFLDTNGAYQKRHDVIPFGIGKRSCLGESMARSELFLTFTALIQQFLIRVPEGETPPTTQGILGFVHHPSPFRVLMERRT